MDIVKLDAVKLYNHQKNNKAVCVLDLMLLRGILKAPKSTPKEMLFLELGLVPFREIIRQRRFGFLAAMSSSRSDEVTQSYTRTSVTFLYFFYL